MLIAVAWSGISQLAFAQESQAALQALRAKADEGDAKAQYQLGTMYGVAKNYPEAVRWFRKAAEQGEAMAQVDLGFHYSNGLGVPQDYAEAVKWYRKAAEQGLPLGQFSLGRMYNNGQGVSYDYVRAYMWSSLAASRAASDEQRKFSDAREMVALKLTRRQLSEAQRLAREWKPTSEK